MNRVASFFDGCTPVLYRLKSIEPFSNNKTLTALLHEFEDRIGQLSTLHSLAQEHERAVAHCIDLLRPIKLRDDIDEEMRIRSVQEGYMHRLKLFVETFYVFAFRVLDITRYLQGSRCLGREQLAPEPKGLINVRNHLIIHPERRKRPILSVGFLVSPFDGRGVILKHLRTPEEDAEPTDAGFWANAEEFRAFISKWMDAAEKHCSAHSGR